jgi:hypothetical protein
MTSDSDDLEEQLRENLKLRRELGDLEEQLQQNLKDAVTSRVIQSFVFPSGF